MERSSRRFGVDLGRLSNDRDGEGKKKNDRDDDTAQGRLLSWTFGLPEPIPIRFDMGGERGPVIEAPEGRVSRHGSVLSR